MIDAHVHVLPGDPEPLLHRLAAFGAGQFNALGVPALWGEDNNLRCLRMKRLYPGQAWAFGGLHWNGRHCPHPERQLELMLQAGFDGLKLLETKPNLQKQLGFLPDDPGFEAMFALAEEKAVPILWHAGDPAPFWHLDLAPDFAVENGWTYEEEGFLSLEEIYRHTEAVLSRHKKLKVILAHLYFCSDDREHLERLLESCPHVSIDITPGSEMYRSFALDRSGWEAFFQKYAGRILLGSDMTNEPENDAWPSISALTRGILKHEPFQIWDVQMTGFRLTAAQYRAITGGNFIRLAGRSPKPVDPEGLRQLMGFYGENLSARQQAVCRKSYEEWFA